MINANNDSYKYELLLAFVIDYCSYPFGDEVYSHKIGDHYKEKKKKLSEKSYSWRAICKSPLQQDLKQLIFNRIKF